MKMTTSKFQEFLSKQNQEKKIQEQTDWQKIKSEWQDRATEFVQQAQDFLAEFEDVKTEVSQVQVIEDNLGEYRVPKLSIHLPKELVELVPIGTLLIGVYGRFDLKGLVGTAKWVLVREETDRPTIKVSVGNDESGTEESTGSKKLAWKLATPPPNIRYLPFEKDIFLEAIMEVSRG